MLKTVAILLAVVAMALLAGMLYLREPERINVDNAYVSGRIIRVYAPRAGYIAHASIRKGLAFEAGEATISYDTEQIGLEIKEQTARFKLDINNELGNCFALQKALTEHERAIVQREHSEVRYRRFQSLVESGSKLSADEVAQRSNEYTVARKNADVAAIEVERLRSLNKLPILERVTVQQSEAQLRKKLHDRSLHRIVLPFAGYVYESLVYAGKYVSEGELLAIVIPREQLMIEANVLESKLSMIKPGQRVGIKPDMHPGVVLDGYVHSVVPSTAATFSSVPRNNTDSNWIKVSQRVPVLVAFESDPPADINRALGASVRLSIHLNGELKPVAELDSGAGRWMQRNSHADEDDYVADVIDSVLETLTAAEKATCRLGR